MKAFSKHAFYQKWIFGKRAIFLAGLLIGVVSASAQSFDTNLLWLEVPTNALAAPGQLNVTLHNTVSGQPYDLFTTEDLGLARSNWLDEVTIPSAPGSNTTVQLYQNGRTNLFMIARYSGDSLDIGIPDWWWLQYGVGANPYDDPAGDGIPNITKYAEGLDPGVFYQPPTPFVAATPLANDNGVIVTWNAAQGTVTSYTLYRNEIAFTNLPANQTSFEDDSTAVSPTSTPTYQIQANYAGGSYALSASQHPTNPHFAISTTIVRGPLGQNVLVIPIIPDGVTTIRVGLQVSGVSYPDYALNIYTYNQDSQFFTPTLGSDYFDVPLSSFTNGQYVIPPSLMPYYGNYTATCYALNTNNGTFGPASQTSQTFQEADPAYIPFVDAREQLKQNLAFWLEAADETGAFQFRLDVNQNPVPPVYLISPDYAYAGYNLQLDFGDPSSTLTFVQEFKPYEDNYFLRNFVYGTNNVNPNGSLESGVYYNAGSVPPILIPPQTASAFPEYTFVSTDNTNLLAPQLSHTNVQWIYTGLPGNIGVNDDGNGHWTLGNSERNVFGLLYGSAWRLYSDGTTLHRDLLNAGGSLPRTNFTEFFYGQTQAPILTTAGYFFTIPNQDYLPGHAGFDPNTAASPIVITSVGQPSPVTGWAKQEVLNNYPSVKYAFLEQYFDKAYLLDTNGNTTTDSAGILSPYGDFLPTKPGQAALITMPDLDTGERGTDVVQVVALNVDANHDGKMDFSYTGPDQSTTERPYRFWVNDDNDSGDTGGDDIPGHPASLGQTPNGSDNNVNGVRDLVDFFPVYLNIQSLLQLLYNAGYGGQMSVWLKQQDGALNYVDPSVYEGYSPWTPTNDLAYLTDTSLAQVLGGSAGPIIIPGASTYQITASGAVLDSAFVDRIRTQGLGMMLIEARTNTVNPLVMEVHIGTQVIARSSVYLSITGVEQMFRHKNLMLGVTATELGAPADRLTDSSVPNEPDTSNTNFVFLHGYNVNPTEARGTFAETFKRMYWSGSHAKFYGVTWKGSETQDILSSIPFLPPITPDYHVNVANAFETAPKLAGFLATLTNGPTTVLAHSLGNMVVLATLNGYDAPINNYFMMDAAVPIEAIDGGAPIDFHMTHSTWVDPEDYATRLYASYWWTLFPTNDARSTLAWSNRLGNFHSAQVFNFYSSGEEVLREYNDDPPVSSFGSAALLAAYWEAHPPLSSFVWVWQEKAKGVAPLDTILGSTHGGWKFNSSYDTNNAHLPAAQANVLPAAELQTNAFFDTSYDYALFNPLTGSDYAQENRNRILSDAIPAVTWAVGSHPVPRLQASGKNFDMNALYENGWPASRSTGDEAFKWHHSDFRDVAYTYVYKLFNIFVQTGNLK